MSVRNIWKLAEEGEKSQVWIVAQKVWHTELKLPMWQRLRSPVPWEIVTSNWPKYFRIAKKRMSFLYILTSIKVDVTICKGTLVFLIILENTIIAHFCSSQRTFWGPSAPLYPQMVPPVLLFVPSVEDITLIGWNSVRVSILFLLK